MSEDNEQPSERPRLPLNRPKMYEGWTNDYRKSKYEKPQQDYEQMRLFDPEVEDQKALVKRHSHELGMIKDLLKEILNRVDALSEVTEAQSDLLDDLFEFLMEND